ncbi:MAG TPA: sigma 54-interacting transcriptional regulator [Nitrospira sp.]|nr:sigma 54-interacting transcriptional regulator [Nitrospira sp.]
MLDRQKSWRLFIASLSLQALGIGSLATLLSAMLWSAAPATLTALDYTVYDTWLRHRATTQLNHSLVIVARDAASEERFGRGPWDRGILAQLIVTIHEAGAAVIGVDHRLNYVSPAQLGGAASDALFLEALRTASPVVLIYDTDSLLQSDAAIYGHITVASDLDHISRHIPPATRIGTQTVPAFGSVLSDIFLRRTAAPIQFLSGNSDADVLINIVGDGSPAALQPISLSSVWNAVERHDEPLLVSWFKDKAVVIRSGPGSSETWLLPSNMTVDGMTAHLHFLNALLNHERIDSLSRFGRSVVTIVLASLTAWSLLRFRGIMGLLLAGAVIVLYGALVIAMLSLASLMMPVATPLIASLFVFIGTVVWVNLTASQRLILLERDMIRIQQESAAVREALVLHEDRAEALQEDLETANEAIAFSAGQQEELTRTTTLLRLQIIEAQSQEQDARRYLQELERQLGDLRAASTISNTIDDAELNRLQTESRQFGIITQDRSLLRLFHDVKKSAKSPLTVLLLGEPGTGKELFAHAIHRLSPRSGETFIAVNMAAISPELFESELFGHTKGSFTGATSDRRGYFGLADHGTIFLDEIGDLRMDHQSKLLRVLQDKSFYRVGATSPTTVDVRIVAATNRNLQKGVSEGWFREDLYFRLNGMFFHLPPLRERTGDIPLLADIFLNQLAESIGKPVSRLTNEALRALSEHEWRGNVRELRHCLEQAITLNDGTLLTRDSLRLGEERGQSRRRTGQTVPELAGDAAVLNCLRRHGFDMQSTAKALGWDRSTVTQRLKGLCFYGLVEANGDRAKAAQNIAGDPTHLRIAELKLRDYYDHLRSVIEPFATAEEALVDCRRRFKNLPERHFSSVETLVQRHFEQDRVPASSQKSR